MWSGMEWGRKAREGSVSGRRENKWDSREGYFLSPIVKIFKSLRLQDLKFPTTVPLDCLHEELSCSQYYSEFLRSTCSNPGVFQFLGTHVKRGSFRLSIHLLVCRGKYQGTVVCVFISFFFLYLKHELKSFIVKGTIVGGDQIPASCLQSCMTRSGLFALV